MLPEAGAVVIQSKDTLLRARDKHRFAQMLLQFLDLRLPSLQ